MKSCTAHFNISKDARSFCFKVLFQHPAVSLWAGTELVCSCWNSRGHPSLLPLQTALFTHNTHTHMCSCMCLQCAVACSQQLRSIKPYTCCPSPSQEKVCTPGVMATASAATVHLVLWSLWSGGLSFQPGTD